MSLRVRVFTLLAVVVVLATAAVLYIRTAAASRTPAVGATAPVTLDAAPVLLTVTDRHLATVSMMDPAGPRTVSAVECVRAYAAGGTGVCLRQATPWAYQLQVLDRTLTTVRSVDIPGLPNRARVSASGRMVAWTTFVGGDSYNSGGFSTRTGILDTRTGTLVPSLEEFTVPARAADRNFWGVTFAADDNTFYATMSSGGQRYLMAGDVAARTLRPVTTNVECPSLSPDGSRIAFKRAIEGDPTKGWRLSVLDLATLAVTPLAETASVDDQPAWLDDRTVAYTLRQADGRPDVWSVPAGGGGAPRLLVPGAESPAALGVPGGANG
ncbi:WD40 repeat protein [Asanoa ferruginea]|uniref:WD40 repeat protein n=1 Tax=Asanoa ferruginea TaxID=53367 RepID=A0A3D9ZW37_9ACTN|nr:PD40 domain-containing protein [Asanoa ferruginea]REG01467.1 WD40 repeat protein [Asanoa ferruginea]GIF47906.1 TolB-like translocation protein; signal peptide [Asanoa ferruginea]